MKYYCTYFDKNYVVRALALSASLESHSEPFRLFALCLDNESYQIILQFGTASIIPLKLEDIEKHDKSLLKTKNSRTKIEYYFTLTPCLPLYIFSKFDDINELTYVDCDLYFFSNPLPVFKEIEVYAVALSPHNFDSDNAENICYGIYNVGWITWKNTMHGLNALNWYREKCIEWCYDRLEGNKFADQRYLDQIADMPDVGVINHKGVNVGEWRCNYSNFSFKNDQILIDDVPLVCYHFQQFWLNDENHVDTIIPANHNAPSSLFIKKVFEPYARELSDILIQVNQLFPKINLKKGTRSLESEEMNESPKTTNSSAGLLGWDDLSIVLSRVKQIKEIKGSLQSHLPLGNTKADHHNLITFGYVLGLIAMKDKISILDWGGAFGHYYFYAKRLFPNVQIDYTCKELPNTIIFGKQYNKEISFVDDDQEAVSQTYDLVFASSSLQYSDDWQKTLYQLSTATNKYLFIARIHLIIQEISQRVKETAYGKNIDSWLINRREFYQEFTKNGFIKCQEFHTFESVSTQFGELEGRSFLLERIN